MALQIAQRAYVLETGTIVLEGSAKELRESARVREAYLGH
jgi:branched-chain amino acid transport system ATP-binding protein